MFVISGINRKLKYSQLPKTYQCILPGTTPVPNYTDDPAYPLTPFCIKELDKQELTMRKLFSIVCFIVSGIQSNELLRDSRLGGQSSLEKWI